jgi:hypothetical protein
VSPPPASAEIGTTLIVSVSQPRGERATLYRLCPRRIEGAPPWRDVAAATAKRIWLSITRDLPVVFEFGELDRAPEWSARLLGEDRRDSGDRDVDLQGDSYGAAFLLASASRLMATAVPSDLVALACVAEDGRTGSVDMLTRKIECLLAWAPGVARIAVHFDQKSEALEAVARSRSDITVCEVRNARDLHALAFPHVGEVLPAALLSDAAGRRKLQDRIFALTVRPKLQVTDWTCVSRTAATLAKSAGLAEIDREKLSFVRSIADRHAGTSGPFVLASDELLGSVARTLRSACIAQSIQALTDGGPFDAAGRARLGEYEAMLGSEETEEQLTQRGALGRAWAAQRQYARAREALERAVEGWTALVDAENRSRALCELVRVQGVIGDEGGVERSRELIETSLGEVGPWSRCFQVLALGRALVLVGRFEDARATLERGDVPWAAMPPHVRDARTRWMAAALSGSGDHHRAAGLRASLSQGHADPANRLLGMLDAALESGNDDAIDPLLEQFATTCRQAAEPLLQVDGRSAEGGRILAREYPY